MAKRFIDTEIMLKPWYRNLEPRLKSLWVWMITRCDMAGVLDMDWELVSFTIGATVSIDDIEKMNGNVVSLQDNKIIIPGFIPFQYGELRNESTVHKGVLKVLSQHGIDYPIDFNLLKGYAKGMQKSDKGIYTSKNKNKAKDIDIAKNKDRGSAKGELELAFDSARKLYPGVKRGLKTEFDNFVKKHADWKEVVFVLEQAIKNQIEHRALLKEAKVEFIPEWKFFQTWIKQRCWEDEVPAVDTARASPGVLPASFQSETAKKVREALAERF